MVMAMHFITEDYRLTEDYRALKRARTYVDAVMARIP